MDVGAIAANSLDLQSLLMNGSSGLDRKSSNDVVNQNADYAKKGEPMYIADMDSDQDGTVTIDEFREYCKSQGMNSKEVVKLSQMAAAFRTMKAETEAFDYISKLIPNVHPNVKQADSESSYLRGDENKYNISDDANKANNVSYKEYMEYCEQNVTPRSLRADTKTEEAEDGKLEIKNYGKAVQSYAKSEESGVVSTFKKEV